MPKRGDYSLGKMMLGDFFEIQDEISKQTDRAAAIIASSFVEEHLRYAVDGHFVAISDRTSSRLFEGNGPLSTFYARILTGYALGLFDRDTREELIVISRIRNFFAHTIKAIDFKDGNIEELCDQLQYPKRFLKLYPRSAENRWKFDLSCWFCRSILANSAPAEKPSYDESSITFEVLAEARFAAEPHGRSSALPHIPPRTSGRTPSTE